MIGTRLKEYRLKRSFRANRMASLIGISVGVYWAIEHEKATPSAETLAKMARRTDLNLYWLLIGEGPMLRENGGIEINPDLLQDSNFLDIMRILKDDPDTRNAVHECLAGVKGIENVARVLKRLLCRRVDGLLTGEIGEDYLLLDIMKILKKNGAARQAVYDLLGNRAKTDVALKPLAKKINDKKPSE